MKDFFKVIVHVILSLICFLSLLAIYNFCTTAYILPVERMCRVYAFSLWWVSLLFSLMLVLVFAIDDAVWEHIGGNEIKSTKRTVQIRKANPTEAKGFRSLFAIYEEEPTDIAQAQQAVYKKAKLKCALQLLPVYIVLAELTLYAVSELGHLTCSVETYLLFGGATALMLSMGMFFRRSILCGELNQALTTRQKMALRCIVTAACAISALLLVPSAAGRITTYNMYWEGSPRTPYSFTYKVCDGCDLSVENIDGFREDLYTSDFDLLPRKVLSKFAEDGWTIRIDSNYLAERSWQSNGKRYGPLFYAITDYTSKTVIAHSAYFAMQEIGRYCYDEIADKETVDQLFATEAESFRTDSAEQEISQGAPFENAEHFFAFCFAKYAVAQDNVKAETHLAR